MTSGASVGGSLGRTSRIAPSQGPTGSRLFADLCTEEVERALAENVLLVPVGSIEQHGPHLPLSVDCDIPAAICRCVAERVQCLIAPTIPFTARSLPQSGGGSMELPGTIHVRGVTLHAYLYDVLSSFIRSGSRSIVLVNGHYETEAFLFDVVAQLGEEGMGRGVDIIALSWWSLVDGSLIETLTDGEFAGWHAEHASFVETSLMMHIGPGSVREVRVDNERPPEPGILVATRKGVSASVRGVLHRTSAASERHGAVILGHIVDGLTAKIEKEFEWGARDGG